MLIDTVLLTSEFGHQFCVLDFRPTFFAVLNHLLCFCLQYVPIAQQIVNFLKKNTVFVRSTGPFFVGFLHHDYQIFAVF